MPLPLSRRWRELLILLLLMSVTTPIFWLTDLDQRAAALFYQGGDGHSAWAWGDWWLWRGLFAYAPKMLGTVAVGALLLAITSYAVGRLTPWRRPALYVALVIALGSGVVVNWVFKDNWGRPRPLHTSELGGHNDYVPPLQIGGTPHKSFPCGHCSVGYALFALYFLSRKRKAFYFALTLVAAFTMGLSRMAAGGHFISDILWSGYLVFLVAWLLYYGWYERGQD
ncbi:MAG: phosphatase PAP2 family protein [Methylovulum miyakonense]|uniref:phosphatase PAP2 family protein n=1 Tax=Methylovulum miyakonense TaxID=645578 RepID=UPI003BB65A38